MITIIAWVCSMTIGSSVLVIIYKSTMSQLEDKKRAWEAQKKRSLDNLNKVIT